VRKATVADEFRCQIKVIASCTEGKTVELFFPSDYFTMENTETTSTTTTTSSDTSTQSAIVPGWTALVTFIAVSAIVAQKRRE